MREVEQVQSDVRWDICFAGVLEEAKFFGIEELYSQLESLCVTVNRPRDDLSLTRRDVIDVLMATSSSASEMRFQGVNLVSSTRLLKT